MSGTITASEATYRPTFDVRAVIFGVGVPVLMAAGLGLWLLSVAGRMPDPVASHFDASGVADDFSGFTSTAIAAVVVTAFTGAVCGFCIALYAVPLAMRRFGVGFSILITAFCVMIFVAGIAPQLDAADAAGTRLDWGLFWAGVGLAVLPAIGLPWLLKRDDHVNAVPAEVPDGSHLDVDAARRGEAVEVKISGSRTLMTVLGVLMFGSIAWLAVASWWWLVVAAVLTAALLAFFVATVRADADGLSVRLLGSWRMVSIPVSDFRVATAAREIYPMQYGGWGYRISAWGSAFVVRTGPAVVLHLAGGKDFVVNTDTLQNAERMAAVLNGYKTAALS
ncbi:hypothetical protein [Arthrobacter sp. NPDC089319]|uniref:hypothetical protein n=1 Tax=Arthrobacter sp. NPDC089319 TaxID=3155915 RepID=UPI003428C3B6